MTKEEFDELADRFYDELTTNDIDDQNFDFVPEGVHFSIFDDEGYFTMSCGEHFAEMSIE